MSLEVEPNVIMLQEHSLIHWMDDLVLWTDVSGGNPTPDLLTIKWGSSPPWLACWVDGPGVDVHSVSISQGQRWEGNRGHTYWGHPWFPKVYRCGWETSGQEASLPESPEWVHSATPSGKEEGPQQYSGQHSNSSSLQSGEPLHTSALPRVFTMR